MMQLFLIDARMLQPLAWLIFYQRVNDVAWERVSQHKVSGHLALRMKVKWPDKKPPPNSRRLEKQKLKK
jgi:hypothetical protein